MKRALPEHAGALEALHSAAFSAPWKSAEFETLLRQPGVAGWIAGAGSPTGFILVRSAADESEILTLAVDPGYRRGGVASGLLKSAIDTLRAAHTLRLYLEVAADNSAACALYERHGFTLCGRRAGYYTSGTTRTDALTMMLALQP